MVCNRPHVCQSNDNNNVNTVNEYDHDTEVFTNTSNKESTMSLLKVFTMLINKML